MREDLPERIGPYRVDRWLGRGGMGEVVQAYDEKLDRPVALKRILPGRREHDAALERFRREARAAARLSHSSIVQVHGWEESDDGDCWLVMELVEGTSLDQRLIEGPLAPRRALEIARDLAAGLAEAHDAGIVHRDLKASNVLVSAKGRAKILDFGLAKVYRPADATDSASIGHESTLTAEGQVVGTVTAMSPEQALGRAVDHRSDLFALGSLLYEMLSGDLPFVGESPLETLTRICSHEEEPLHLRVPTLARGVSVLVGRLLAKDPAARPSDAHAIVDALDALLEADAAPTMAAGSPKMLERTRTDAHRTPSRHAPPSLPRRTAAASAILLVAGGLWATTSWLERAADAIRPVAAAETPPPAAPLTAFQHYQRGLEALDRYDRTGALDRAIDEFQRALALDADFAPALAGLAQAYHRTYRAESRDPQSLAQALAAAEQAVAANEHLAAGQVSLGMVLAEGGRLDAADEALTRALEIEPDNADAMGWQGRVAELRGETERAEERYRQAIVHAPDHWYWHAFLGAFLFASSRFDEACAAFEQQRALTPDNFVVLRNLGACHYMQGELTEAAARLQEALEIREDASTFSNLGTIYFSQGLYTRAVSAFEKALHSGGSTHYQQWANLGDAYRWTPDNEAAAHDAYARALRLLDDKLATTPNDLNLQTLVPLYEAKRGDCPRAMAAIPAGIAAIGDATALYQVAVAQELCGRREEALVSLERARQAGYPQTDLDSDPELAELRRDRRYDAP
ncbi:MAG: protein kinase [Acidobacteriota bacterium]